ncbi:MAG: NAD(P)-dependent oxidoreductase [Deltaproteobacteria bacterium]|nr:NAD(P)-dependent oxidoreductase [Deltaproteobacteria bacterium]
MVLSPVMVVGGSGFLGSHVCRELAERNIEVISFDIQSSDFQSRKSQPTTGSIRFVKGDILDPESLVDCVNDFKVTGIIHTVAAGNEAAARQDPHPAITLNVQGTLNVLEAARKNQVGRFVYISTAGVYGRRSNEEPIKEDEAITWRGTIYHPSHYMGEVLVEMYHRVYEMETVILRPLSIYGPALSSNRERHLQTKSLFLGAWIMKALKGEVVEIRSDTLTDLTYVKDVATAVYLAYSNPDLKQGVYNVSSGVLVSYKDIALTLQKYLPHAKFEFRPGVQDNPLRPNRGPLDISRAKEAVHFVPQYGLGRGMHDFIEWCIAS